eukprot:1630744-Prymnesium_polylepis.1
MEETPVLERSHDFPPPDLGWWTINIPCSRLRGRGDFWRLSSKACPELQQAAQSTVRESARWPIT